MSAWKTALAIPLALLCATCADGLPAVTGVYAADLDSLRVAPNPDGGERISLALNKVETPPLSQPPCVDDDAPNIVSTKIYLGISEEQITVWGLNLFSDGTACQSSETRDAKVTDKTLTLNDGTRATYTQSANRKSIDLIWDVPREEEPSELTTGNDLDWLLGTWEGEDREIKVTEKSVTIRERAQVATEGGKFPFPTICRMQVTGNNVVVEREAGSGTTHVLTFHESIIELVPDAGNSVECARYVAEERDAIARAYEEEQFAFSRGSGGELVVNGRDKYARKP